MRHEIPICHPNLSTKPIILHAGMGSHGGQQRQECFRLDGLWALHAYPYEAEIEWLGKRNGIRPGTVGLTPPNIAVRYRYTGPSRHRYAHFKLCAPHPPSQTKRRKPYPLLTLQEEEGLYARVWDDLAQIALLFRTRRLHAEVLLWSLLLEVENASQTTQAPAPVHPALEAASAIIEEEIDQVIRAKTLADRVGMSLNQLIRLFSQAYGMPVATYIRGRRMERAAHLLKHSDMTVKSIACSVGIPDLHAFNKLIHAYYTTSPRAMR